MAANGMIEQLFLTSFEARILVDENGTIRFATPLAAKLLGYGLEDLRGSRLTRILLEEASTGLIRGIAGKSVGEPEAIRLDFINKQGGHTPWQCSVFRLESSERGTSLLIHLPLDVDGLNREIELLTHRLELFAEMADVVPAIFWVQNKEGTEIHYVNRAYQDVYGVPIQTLIQDSSSWLHFVHPEDRPRVSRIWWDSTLDRSEIEFRIVRPDGAVRWVIDTYIPVFDRNGDVIRKVGFGVDVTALKMVNDELKAKETELKEQAGKLEKLNTALPGAGRAS